jgi:hypothetical protein
MSRMLMDGPADGDQNSAECESDPLASCSRSQDVILQPVGERLVSDDFACVPDEVRQGRTSSRPITTQGRRREDVKACVDPALTWCLSVERVADVARETVGARTELLDRSWLRGVDLNHRPLGYEASDLGSEMPRNWRFPRRSSHPRADPAAGTV